MTIDTRGLNEGRSAAPGGAADSSDFERHIPRVYDWALRLTRCRDKAMDVLQDVFLKWRRQCRTAPPQRPEAWLRTVTANRVFELSRSPRLATIESEALEAAARHFGSQARSPADERQLHCDIVEALQRLTDMQRDVLLAKIVDEQTFAQIAADQQVSVSTVKTHYLRAVRAMQTALGPRWRNE